MAKFEKNISRRGVGPPSSKHPFEPAHVVLILFAVLVVASCKLFNFLFLLSLYHPLTISIARNYNDNDDDVYKYICGCEVGFT